MATQPTTQAQPVKTAGYFETGRRLFAGLTGSALQSLLLVEDASKTARSALIPSRVENLAEAKDTLQRAGWKDFKDFKAEEDVMLG
jgi:hypothetical protein